MMRDQSRLVFCALCFSVAISVFALTNILGTFSTVQNILVGDSLKIQYRGISSQLPGK